MIWALVALVGAAAALAFFLRDVGQRPDLRSPAQAAEPTTSHTELIAALDRLSKEVADLRIALRRVEMLTRNAEATSADSRRAPIPSGSREGESPREIVVSAASAEAIRAKPDPEKRGRIDSLIAAPYEDRARPHWFLSLEALLDRYGPPDGVGTYDNGSIRITYRGKDGHAYFQFVDGVCVGVQVEGQ